MDAPIPADTTFWHVTPDLLGVLDRDGHFTQTNPAWAHTLGYTAEQIQNRPFFDFLHPDDLAASKEGFAEILDGTPVLNLVNRYRHADGSYRWLSWNAAPDGDKFFCSARDITASKLTQTRLDRRNQEAQFREQFIAVLGHDLRNPVAAVNAARRLHVHDAA